MNSTQKPSRCCTSKLILSDLGHNNIRRAPADVTRLQDDGYLTQTLTGH